MVAEGQILERPALIPCEDFWLEGLYHRGVQRPSLLVCPPYEDDGGMDAPCVAELAFVAARAGHASLRFSHRGRGASQGTADASRSLDDALAAWRHLAECDGPRIAIAGYLSGCSTALSLARAHKRTRRVALVAPVIAPDMLGPTEGLEILVLLPELGGAWAIEAWRAALDGGRAEVIPGADARFLSGLPIVGEQVVAWIGGDERRASSRLFDDGSG